MCYLCTCCYLFKCIPTNAVRCCFYICRSSVRSTSMRTPCCLYNAIKWMWINKGPQSIWFNINYTHTNTQMYTAVASGGDDDLFFGIIRLHCANSSRIISRSFGINHVTFRCRQYSFSILFFPLFKMITVRHWKMLKLMEFWSFHSWNWEKKMLSGICVTMQHESMLETLWRCGCSFSVGKFYRRF